MAASKGEASKVFGWFSNMTSVAGLLTWFGIFITYIRWYEGTKVQPQNINRKELPFTAPLMPWAAYYGLVMVSLVIFFNGWAVFIHGNWDTATFVTSYIPLLLYVVLYFGYKFYNKTSFISLHDMDFITGSRDIEEEEELPPKNLAEKFWRAIM